MKDYQTYKDSLSSRLESAKYHRDTIRAIHKSTSIEESYIPVSFEFTAMMLALQSSLDILAQLLNCISGNYKMSEGSVSFHSLYLNIDRTNFKMVVKDKIIKLHECNERKYLNAFCNVSKHRRMIKVSDQCAFVSSFQPIQYLVVNRFEYNGDEFQEIDLLLIARDIFNTIYSGINEIELSFKI